MQKTKKVGLGQNTWKSKLFYTLLVFLPSLQFLIFYIIVNINSFSLAFKVWELDADNQVNLVFGWKNFAYWFDDSSGVRTQLIDAIIISLETYGISMITGLPLGLFFSYYMFKKMPGSKLFRVLLFMPSILSAGVLATIYKQLTEFVVGGANGWFDIYFWDSDHRFASMMIFNIFVSFGTSVLMYTNKMDSIAPEIIESAHLDGANGLSEFWYIILPQIFSIMQVFLMSGFAGIFTNQHNVLMLWGQYSVPSEMQSVGYLLWRAIYRAGGAEQTDKLGEPAALGLMISAVIIPLTFLLRWIMNKVGWKEE